jgi:phenylacetate-CoA ligase
MDRTSRRARKRTSEPRCGWSPGMSDHQLPMLPRPRCASLPVEKLSNEWQRCARLFPRILWYLAEGLRSYKQPPEEVEAYREKKLKTLMKFAYSYVPYYHSLLRTGAFDPRDGFSLEDLTKMPILSSSFVKQNNRLLRVLRPGQVFHERTSATTGKSGDLLWSYSYTDRRSALTVRRLAIIHEPYWVAMARIYPHARGAANPNLSYIRAIWKWLFEPFGQHGFTLRPSMIPVDPDNVLGAVKALRASNATIYHVQPSIARIMARVMEENGIRLHPKILDFNSEVVTDRDRRLLEEQYQSEVVQSYGMAEFGPVGTECRYRDYFHFYSDNYHLEVIRNGEQVGPGEWGELVVSPLHNYPMPLIRYNTGDIVRLNDEQGMCECGTTLLRIKSVLGRTVDSLVNTDGTMIPQRMLLDAVETASGVSEYKIVQKSRTSILLKVSKADIDSGRATLAKKAIFAMLGEPTVELEEWERKIEVGKFRPAISYEQQGRVQPSS